MAKETKRSFSSTNFAQVSVSIKLTLVSIGGNLMNLIHQRTNQGLKGLPESEVLMIAAHVVQGLVHMHTQQPPIAHRDVKPENILTGADNKWKLCDFGSSTTAAYSHIDQDVSYPFTTDIN